MDTKKFCRDCKHIILHEPPQKDFGFARCGLAPLGANFVSGESSGFRFCNVERKYDIEGSCGPEGRNFEPKESSHE